MPDPVTAAIKQPYPAVRYHQTHGNVRVMDVDDEITKCGEACDTVNHTENKLGWRDRPYPAPPKPAPPPPMPSNIADLVVLVEKHQRAIGNLQATVAALESQLVSVRDRVAFVEEMVANAPSQDSGGKVEPVTVLGSAVGSGGSGTTSGGSQNTSSGSKRR